MYVCVCARNLCRHPPVHMHFVQCFLISITPNHCLFYCDIHKLTKLSLSHTCTLPTTWASWTRRNHWSSVKCSLSDPHEGRAEARVFFNGQFPMVVTVEPGTVPNAQCSSILREYARVCSGKAQNARHSVSQVFPVLLRIYIYGHKLEAQDNKL